MSPQREAWRPDWHFSPDAAWMNDPNGLVFFEGEYHLFFQYHPGSTVWGPMHWGHAVSADLLHWQELPIALHPDGHGTIFSGSVVVDRDNSSGLVPGGGLVAMFSYDSQAQGVAGSLDRGRTWTVYPGNPVIPARHKDFRDPKVFRHDGAWSMVLAAGDHLQFWRSADLLDWQPTGRFDWPLEAGVWECPDLFPLPARGSAAPGAATPWVLLLSLGDLAVNGGSGTLYFVGDFDGRAFHTRQDPAWLDWGTDNYAAVTFNDAPGGERLLIGWMNNWRYARLIPETAGRQRGAMTMPRRLALVADGGTGRFRLIQEAVRELHGLRAAQGGLSPDQGSAKVISLGSHPSCCELALVLHAGGLEPGGHAAISLRFDFDHGTGLELIWEPASALLSLDRSRSGEVGFHRQFAERQTMRLERPADSLELRMYLDRTSLEIFAEGGRSVMTALFFPDPATEEFRLEARADSGLVRVSGFCSWRLDTAGMMRR